MIVWFPTQYSILLASVMHRRLEMDVGKKSEETERVGNTVNPELHFLFGGIRIASTLLRRTRQFTSYEG
jgi:hypothetical protein